MFEFLVPATHEQMDRLDGDQHIYDTELRPSLMIESTKELEAHGVEPDVWKIEDSIIASTARSSPKRRAGADGKM